MPNKLKEMIEKEFSNCETIDELKELLLALNKLTEDQTKETIERICKE